MGTLDRSPALAPPPGNPRFPLFDALRGLAVLGVLVFHASELTGRVGFGVAGAAAEVLGSVPVITFYVISGFLLYRPFVATRFHDAPTPSTSRYSRRRALRILPAYFAVLTLLAIYPGITGVFSHDWWRYYGFLQLYSARTQNLGIPVAWTLCVEVTFYISLPLWALAVRRLSLGSGARGTLTSELVALAALGLGGAAILLLAARQDVSQQLGISIAGQCVWLATGMAFAVLSAHTELSGGPPAWLVRLADVPELCWSISIGALAGLAALVPAGGLFGLIAQVKTPQPLGTSLARVVLQFVLVTFLVLPLVFEGRRRGLPRWLLSTRPLVGLGVISYSFYLLHLTIAEFIAWHTGSAFSAHGLNLLAHLHWMRTLVLFVLSLLATTVVASVSYRCIELPFLRRKEPARPSYPAGAR